jgi:acetyl-CoA acetyltransferase
MPEALAHIEGVGLHPFGRHPEQSLGDLAAVAIDAALRDGGCEIGDIDVACVGNSLGGALAGQETIRGQVALRSSGLTGIPVLNVENACASSSSALHAAIMAVRSGMYRTALAVGVEKMYVGDTSQTLRALGNAATEGLYRVHGLQFTSLYAMAAKAYLADNPGAELADFARVSVKNAANGARNDAAQFRRPRTVEQVLESRPIAEPLTLLMCCGIADGASAAVVTAAPRSDRAVRVLASALRSGAYRSPRADPGPSSVALAARDAYEQAGVGAQDVGVVELHDAAAPQELMHLEDLGLSERGRAWEMTRAGETALDGRLPVNPSGGLLSRGHAIGATGLAQVAEVCTQLRGEAGERQIRSSRPVGLTLNTGGRTVDDRAAIAVHLLAAR